MIPHLNLQALTWPPKDNATVQRQGVNRFTLKINHSSDEDSDAPLTSLGKGTSSSGFEFAVLQRSWKPTCASEARQRMEEDEDDKLPVPRDRKLRPSARKIDYNEDKAYEDSDFENLLRGTKDKDSAEPPRPISATKIDERKRGRAPSGDFLGEPLCKKPKHRLPSPGQETTTSTGQHSDSAFRRNGKSRRNVQQPTPQSAPSSMNDEVSDSDSDLVILDEVPCYPKIKEEMVRVKEEPFSVEVSCLSHM